MLKQFYNGCFKTLSDNSSLIIHPGVCDCRFSWFLVWVVYSYILGFLDSLIWSSGFYLLCFVCRPSFWCGMISGWLCFLSFSLGPPVLVRQKQGGWTLLITSFNSLHLIKTLCCWVAVGILPASAVVGTGGSPTQPYWHFVVCPLLFVEEWWKISSLLNLSDNTQSIDGSILLVSKGSKKMVWKINFLFTCAKLARAEDYVASTSIWLE